jgi:hypothetical protein
MAVMATEAPAVAEGAGIGGAGSLPGMGGGGGGERPEPNRAVLLAVAIALLWLAGLAFFIAIEGLHVEQGKNNGSGILASIMATLTTKADAQQTNKQLPPELQPPKTGTGYA